MFPYILYELVIEMAEAESTFPFKAAMIQVIHCCWVSGFPGF